eukprot:TRINITY_DN4321_c0_g1_i2.p3 TRINITY_DN4321_c0_g1~~TRINITY_DN4321_c0_g1_i2.p3  ORF type:complete len:114 (-),score=14.59 TRINITY_DN4321_c0_g1_i2:505-846(-)
MRAFTATATAPSHHCPRRCIVPHASRRASALGLLLAPVLVAVPAHARDAEAAKAASEERKRKLREAADISAETGRDQKVFEDSDYMMSEDARTPNVHSRQDEGSKTQINVQIW